MALFRLFAWGVPAKYGFVGHASFSIWLCGCFPGASGKKATACGVILTAVVHRQLEICPAVPFGGGGAYI